MLAHIGGHGSIGLQILIELVQHIGGGHALPLVLTCGFLLPQLLDMCLPLRPLYLPEQGQQLLQGQLHIAPETVGRIDSLVQLRSVDVDMDDLCILGELGTVAGDPVIEPSAQGDDGIGVVHGGGAGVMAVHTLHTQEPGMVGGDTGDTHHGAAHGSIDLVRQLQQLCLGLAGDQAAAEVDKGLRGGIDGIRRLLDADLLGRLLRLRQHRSVRLVIIGRHLHILRHIHQHRAGTAGGRQLEGFPDGIRQVLDAANEVVVLGDRQRDTGNIDLLEAIGADDGIGNIAGDGHHGDGVQISGGDAGDQVGSAGAGGGDTHAHLTGGTGIAVSSVGSALLMGGQHMLQLALVFIKGVINIDDLTAGIAEHNIDPLLDQSSHDNIRTGQLHRIILSSYFQGSACPFRCSPPFRSDRRQCRRCGSLRRGRRKQRSRCTPPPGPCRS